MQRKTEITSFFAPLSSELCLRNKLFKLKSNWVQTFIQDGFRSRCMRCYSVRAQMSDPSFDEGQLWSESSSNIQKSLKRYIAGTLFPTSLEEAVQQASQAILTAVKDKYNRLRVELQYPTLSSSASLIEYGHLAYFCNMVCEAFLGQCKRVRLFGETRHVLSLVPFLDTRLSNSISVSCIDDVQSVGRRLSEDICLILLPSNVGHDMGKRMENFERLVYSISHDKYIILLNAYLEACTTLTCGGRPFEPMILNDFHIVYFVHPNIVRHGCLQSSLLRCYPRDWELFILRLPRDTSTKYFLAKSFTSRPSVDRIEVEVSCYFHSM